MMNKGIFVGHLELMELKMFANVTENDNVSFYHNWQLKAAVDFENGGTAHLTYNWDHWQYESFKL